MKVDSIPLPSEKKPSLTLVRIFPESVKDRELLDRIETYLRATNAVVARPTIDKEKILSIMFTHAKKNQETKA